MNRPLTESSIMHGVKTMLAIRGWIVKRMPPSIYSSYGLPDLYAAKNGVSVWIECKNPNPKKGKLSSAQRRFAYDMDTAGVTYIVARNVEFVEQVLREKGWW